MSATDSPSADGEADDSSSSISQHQQQPPPASPLSSLPNEFRETLDEFRNNWQQEIKNRNTKPNEIQQNTETAAEQFNNRSKGEDYELAVSYFRQGVELEQGGKVYDALAFYRRAVHIDPDIELKFYERQKLAAAMPINKTLEIETTNNQSVDVESPGSEDDSNLDDLYKKFSLDFAHESTQKLIQSNQDVGVLSTNTHISELPPEILMYIISWVVSNQLDMRSLERCAAVCRGLYLCARDEQIWRLACIKVWGDNVGNLNEPIGTVSNNLPFEKYEELPVYVSWRQMFIERERVLYNGCYISKARYIRMGENSFQDQYYRPIQLVDYYRYIRFLPDGKVYMMTTADEPTQAVPRLKNLQQLRSDVLRGKYSLNGDIVTIILKKHQVPQRIATASTQYPRGRRNSSAALDEYNSTTYCIEFRILNTNKKRFVKLVWVHYSVIVVRNKIETTNEFDLKESKFPPLWFSPVRSYDSEADAPLGK